jgi:hypothetical protein
VDNYTLVKITGSHLLWQKNPGQSWQKPDFSSEAQKLSVKDNRVALPQNPTGKPMLAVVTISYEPAGFPAKIPVLNKSPRYLLTPYNAISDTGISLPPYMTKWTFPIYLKPHSKDAYLEVSSPSLVPGAKLNIKSIDAQKVPLSDTTLQGLLDIDGPLKP